MWLPLRRLLLPFFLSLSLITPYDREGLIVASEAFTLFPGYLDRWLVLHTTLQRECTGNFRSERKRWKDQICCKDLLPPLWRERKREKERVCFLPTHRVKVKPAFHFNLQRCCISFSELHFFWRRLLRKRHQGDEALSVDHVMCLFSNRMRFPQHAIHHVWLRSVIGAGTSNVLYEEVLTYILSISSIRIPSIQAKLKPNSLRMESSGFFWLDLYLYRNRV